MCTPIVIENPQVDLSKDPLATSSDPAGTGVTAPQPTASATPTTTDADTKAADPGAGSGDPPPRVAIDTAAAGPDGAINATPTATATPVDAGATTKVLGPQPEGSTPHTSGPDGIDKPNPVLDQNTLLINSLTDLAHHVTDTTAGILGAQSNAADALKSGFLDLNKAQQDALAAADQLRKNTGQAARKPSYSLSLAKNARANSGGVSSTMLTGSKGVPTNSLALGRAQLLGGDAA